jgi:hypothetical protein
MTAAPEQIRDGETLTVRIPLRLRKRGGRKLLVVPQGAAAWAPPRPCVDSAMVKAIARAHRWRRLLESGEHASITDLGAAEKINQSYVCRILRLTLLAPDIVEKILDGWRPPNLQLALLLKPFPIEWGKQRAFLFSVSEVLESGESEKDIATHFDGSLRSVLGQGARLPRRRAALAPALDAQSRCCGSRI